MLRSTLVALVVLIPLYIVSPAGAQTPVFDADFFKVVNAELKEKPQLSGWGDVKNLRTSTFYTGVSATLGGMLTSALSQSKCFKKLTIADLDHALLLASDLDQGATERGYLAISGNLDAAVVLKCLAAEQKWTPTSLKNYPVYETDSGTVKSYIYAVGNDAIVLVAGDWANKIEPGKNVLGAGKLAGFAKARVLAMQMDKAPKGSDFKSMQGELKAGTDLDFAGSVTYVKERDAIELQKNADTLKKQGTGAGLTFANTLKVTRTKTRLDGTMKMTQPEFVVVMSLLNSALFGNQPAKTPPPKKNNAQP